MSDHSTASPGARGGPPESEARYAAPWEDGDQGVSPATDATAATEAQDATATAAPAVDSPEHDRQAGGFWLPLSVTDMNAMQQGCPEMFPSMLAVWCVLVREACFRRTNVFTLANGIVSDRAKVSRRTVDKVKPALVDLRLLSFRADRNAGTKRRESTVYSITPAVLFVQKTALSAAQGFPCATDGGVSTAQTLTMQGLSTVPCNSKRKHKPGRSVRGRLPMAAPRQPRLCVQEEKSGVVDFDAAPPAFMK